VTGKDEISEQEAQILAENAQKLLDQLKPGDKKYIGFDAEMTEFWVYGKKFKPKQVGLTTRKEISDLFDRYEEVTKQVPDVKEQLENLSVDTVKKPAEKGAGIIELSQKFTNLLGEQDRMEIDIPLRYLPILLLESNGKPFVAKKWFADESGIAAATWWDVTRDLYYFLRVKGTKAEMLRLLTQSNLKSPTDSTTTKTSAKAS